MENIKISDIIRVTVTGVQKYGAFVNTADQKYQGLIHISEISYGFVKSVNDYLKVGDDIFAEVVNIDDKDNHLKLSIKDIDYKKDGARLKRMAETKNGFTPLRDNLDIWINKKIKEITDKM
jgi:general stress protein 13